jgi:hypothetical protein
VAQDAIGVKASDFIGVFGRLLLLAKKDEMAPQAIDFTRKSPRVPRRRQKTSEGVCEALSAPGKAGCRGEDSSIAEPLLEARQE